jgi:Tfp pilus assembly protein PilF
VLQLVDSTRDFDDEATSDKADAFKLAALGNLALCELGQGEPARAVEWCDRALKLEPENAKVPGGWGHGDG